jgi:hypothetical protein
MASKIKSAFNTKGEKHSPYQNNNTNNKKKFEKKELWSKKKELKDCDLVLSAYKNNLGKPLYLAKDVGVKYWRYIKPEEFLKDNLNKRHIDDFPIYVYGHGAKRYLDVFVSGSAKNLGKEYYGYEHTDPNVDENSPYSNDRIFICWKDDLIDNYNKWVDYCVKVVNNE